MINLPRVAIVYIGDDWLGLYVDGVLVRQDHNIEPDEILEYLGVPYEVIELDDKDVDHMDYVCSKDLSDMVALTKKEVPVN